MKKIEDFISGNFNDETIGEQIRQQEKIINNAEREIERLNLLRSKQKNMQWFQWNGTSFIHVGYSHSDGFRSHRNCKDVYTNYEDFVITILNEIDHDTRNFYRNDDSDFYIVSPSEESYLVNGGELRTLPLVKEYFERKELQKTIKAMDKELNKLRTEFYQLDKEVANTEKYTHQYISFLIDRKREIQKDIDEKSRNFTKSSTVIKRLNELNQLLSNLDKKMDIKKFFY
ncbi:hypothetical protein NDS46_31810 (plasmid) [Paenibacillus thiaminolyticus]|uniref:hypothetical protein n=1 Tax=Paenibacillus thiaminolyticus TaxID=49283 RepID=UPI0023304A95|nr:hypothetical protein [Paenibacillus thiaminolyticus]WCF11545.1 hypothetical protein NDS46_31810 [Paenibacillus thiaminolyticus]